MELLSPAGNMERLIAAVQSGADAIYFGAPSFNARQFAGNFADIAQAVHYAHLRGVRAYLTLNTLVTDARLAEWFAVAQEAAQAGVDAVIVQDLGCGLKLKELCPSLSLHASTQMTVTNSKQAQMLYDAGFSRIVLARECSKEEISAIAARVPIELEVFVHGALCVCYSGQCLMSSVLGGRSANHGACAQPCRLPYQLQRQSGYLLSPKDLCLVQQIDALQAAGVHSLKIEGRMKSPLYVATVTQIYRKALDGRTITQEDIDLLTLAFSRGGFTQGLFSGDHDRLTTQRPDAAGLPLGKVQSIQGNRLILQTERALAVGDEVAPDAPDAVAQKIKSVTTQNHALQIELNHSKSFRTGTPVRLLSSAALQQSMQVLIGSNQRRTALFGHVALSPNQPATLTLRTHHSQAVTVTSDSPVQLAQTRALTEEDIRKQLCKTGNTPFAFESLTISLQGDCALPVKSLNELRRNAFSLLEQQICNVSHTCAPYHPATFEVRAPQRPRLSAQVQTPEQALAVLPHIDILYLPSHLDVQAIAPQAQQSGVLLAVVAPPVTHELECAAHPFPSQLHTQLCMDGATRFADASIHTTNRETLLALQRMGYQRVTLHSELNLTQIAQLPVPQGLQTECIVYGHLPLMITAHCPVSCDGRHCTLAQHKQSLQDRKGVLFPLRRIAANPCRICIYNSVPLFMADELSKVKADVLRLLFTIEAPQDCKKIALCYQSALQGEAVTPPLTYTRGHFHRGIT